MSGTKPDEQRSRWRISLAGVGVAIAVLAVAAVAAVIVFMLLGRSDSATSDTAATPTDTLPTLAGDADQLAADLQDFWADTFEDQTRTYEPARIAPIAAAADGGCLQLGRNAVSFYCNADQTVYLQAPFLDEVRASSEELAEAYVIAHLLGHHVQELLAITDKVEGQQLNEPDRAKLLHRQLELEADCLAGYGLAGLTGADPPEADAFTGPIEATQAAAKGHVKPRRGIFNPETWENGPVPDQVKWIDRGLTLPDVASCDTFSGQVTE